MRNRRPLFLSILAAAFVALIVSYYPDYRDMQDSASAESVDLDGLTQVITETDPGDLADFIGTIPETSLGNLVNFDGLGSIGSISDVLDGIGDPENDLIRAICDDNPIPPVKDCAQLRELQRSE